MMRQFILYCILILGTTGVLYCQTATPQPTQQTAPTPTPVLTGPVPTKTVMALPGQIGKKTTSNTPKEYTTEEFQDWMLDLRRAEIIFIGSIPIAFFLVTEVYDTYRFTYNGITENEWNPGYVPWPFTALEKSPYNDTENVVILISALTVAGMTAAADFFIGKATGRQLGAKKR